MKTLLTAANIKRNWLRLVGSILQLIPFINFQSGKRQIITHRDSLPSSSLTLKKRKAICGNFALLELMSYLGQYHIPSLNFGGKKNHETDWFWISIPGHAKLRS